MPDTLSLEELRRRLVEAEDTLRAIREGDADAVVVRNANEDTVFALSGGQESYRAIMEAMDIGAIALDDQGRVLYANAAFCALIGCAATQLQHLPIFEKLDANSAQVVRETIEQARHGRHQVQFVQSHRGSNRHLMVTAAPLPMAFGTGCALTFSDVTARVEAAALEESERIGEAVIASANEAVVVCDRAGNIIKANAAASALMPGEAIGRHFTDALPLPSPRTAGFRHRTACLTWRPPAAPPGGGSLRIPSGRPQGPAGQRGPPSRFGRDHRRVGDNSRRPLGAQGVRKAADADDA
ncbi:PAS domain-containing protein [Novosphingobium panipatense]